MFNLVVDGNLVDSPQPAKNPKYLRVKFCHNQREWTKDGIKESKIWVGGLIRPDKIEGIRERLVKGAYVIASTSGSAASLSVFNNEMQVNLNFIGQFDLGRSPADKPKPAEQPQQQQYTHGAIGEPPQQQQFAPPHGVVQQAPPPQQPPPQYQQPEYPNAMPPQPPQNPEWGVQQPNLPF